MFRFMKGLKISAVICSAILMMASLSSCVSTKDYKALERRVSELEEIAGISDNSDNSDTESSDENEDSDNSSSSDKKDSKNSDNSDNSGDDNGTGSFSSSETFSEEEVSKNVDVKEYDYITEGGDKYAFFILTNNSDFNVNARVKLVSKDSSGKELATEIKNARGIPSDGESYVSFKLERDTDTIVRTINYTEFTGQRLKLKNVTAKATTASGGASLAVRNSGSTDVDDLNYLTLFFDGSELAGFDADELPAVSANGSETVQSVFYEEFDSVKVYLQIDD